MYQFILFIHIAVAVCIIAFVIVQQGKGATMGANFGAGGGASQTVFGSRGSGSFLLKLTIGFVFIFFATSIGLNYISTAEYKQAKQTPAKQLPLPLPNSTPNS